MTVTDFVSWESKEDEQYLENASSRNLRDLFLSIPADPEI